MRSAARLRMARIPDGAELIQSATILAPGFKLGNVIVMAGIPSIMQAMMDIVAPKLKYYPTDTREPFRTEGRITDRRVAKNAPCPAGVTSVRPARRTRRHPVMAAWATCCASTTTAPRSRP